MEWLRSLFASCQLADFPSSSGCSLSASLACFLLACHPLPLLYSFISSSISGSHSADDIRKTTLLFNADVNGLFDSECNSHRNVGQWDVNPALRVQHKCARAGNKVSCILFCSLVSIFQLSVLFHCLHPSHVKSGDVKAQNSAAWSLIQQCYPGLSPQSPHSLLAFCVCVRVCACVSLCCMLRLGFKVAVRLTLGFGSRSGD